MIGMRGCVNKAGKKTAGRVLALILAAVLFFLLLDGCGRKGPPRLPEKTESQAALGKIEFSGISFSGFRCQVSAQRRILKPEH
jgi:predicted small lipoprotein YifL